MTIADISALIELFLKLNNRGVNYLAVNFIGLLLSIFGLEMLSQHLLGRNSFVRELTLCKYTWMTTIAAVFLFVIPVLSQTNPIFMVCGLLALALVVVCEVRAMLGGRNGFVWSWLKRDNPSRDD